MGRLPHAPGRGDRPALAARKISRFSPRPFIFRQPRAPSGAPFPRSRGTLFCHLEGSFSAIAPPPGSEARFRSSREVCGARKAVSHAVAAEGAEEDRPAKHAKRRETGDLTTDGTDDTDGRRDATANRANLRESKGEPNNGAKAKGSRARFHDGNLFVGETVEAVDDLVNQPVGGRDALLEGRATMAHAQGGA